MICTVEKLLAEGISNLGLLFVVGEERNSAGARVAAKTTRGSRCLINGEPTENKLCLASKGALRFELVAHGQLAHSGYPELGRSAIDGLLDVLEDIRNLPLPKDSLLGKTTLNIGTISGGRAPNVVADEARAEIDRKSTRLNSSHANISYAVFCLKKKKTTKATPSTTRPRLCRRTVSV